MAISEDAVFWGIHAGATGDADKLFLESDVVALGWLSIGDLSEFGADRDSFKVAVSASYPEKSIAQVANNAGQLFRFTHEMNNGDYVIYRSKSDKRVHIGQVSAHYKYTKEPEPGYPHQRPVNWLKSFGGTLFSQGALYEIGSAMSFFQVKTYSDEFRLALDGAEPEAAIDDDTVGVVADEIQQSTRDFVLKRLEREQKGHPLQDFVADLLSTLGYRTRVTPKGPDGGVDILAHKDELGIEPPLVKVQVKSGAGSVGNGDVAALYGQIENTSQEFGLFITLGSFSAAALNFARNKSNLRLVDGDALVDLVLKHYEQLDPKYQTMIPLTQVYVPRGSAGADAEG